MSRFLNVQFSSDKTRIQMDREIVIQVMSQLQDEIKEKYNLSCGSGSIQLLDEQNRLIDDLRSIPEIYFEEEGPSLLIDIASSSNFWFILCLAAMNIDHPLIAQSNLDFHTSNVQSENWLNLRLESSGRTTEINIVGMKRFSQLQDEIERKYRLSCGSANIQLLDEQCNSIHSMTLLKNLSKNYFEEDGPSLLIRVPASSNLNMMDWCLAASAERSHNDQSSAQVSTTLFLVTAKIENSSIVKGVWSRIYRLADFHIGYYDQKHPNAIHYDEQALMVHILFKSEDKAMGFDSQLRNEECTIGSSLKNLIIYSKVAQVNQHNAELGDRIYYKDYVPEESDSPQGCLSLVTGTYSFYETTTDLFEYQRIEAKSLFSPIGKAESCHIMSRSHCNQYQSYSGYNDDESNRLALSCEMHAYYDGRNVQIPVVNMSVLSVSEAPVVDNRYEVTLLVKVLNHEHKNLVLDRLKLGSAVYENNPLAMTTTVHIINPSIFKKCMEWKYKQIEAEWNNYFSMVSPIP
jgi:hypothetical protein